MERKHRVTFRVHREIAAELRKLPNQTMFVENAIRDALGRTCPLCAGRGRVGLRPLEVSDFKELGLPHLNRQSARRLREIVRLGARLLATRLELGDAGERGLTFRLVRDGEVLLGGALDERSTDLSVSR